MVFIELDIPDDIPTDGTYELTFGKYKGETLESVPSSYLRWLRDKNKNETIQELADIELGFRDTHDAHWED